MQKNYCARGISLPINILQKIDDERGDISRSRFIQRILEKVYLENSIVTKKIGVKSAGNGVHDQVNSHSIGVTNSIRNRGERGYD